MFSEDFVDPYTYLRSILRGGQGVPEASYDEFLPVFKVEATVV